MVDVAVEEHVGQLQPAAGADLPGRDLPSVDESDEVGARHVQQVRRLLRGDLLVVVGDDPDVLAPLDVIESVRNHPHDRRRYLDRRLIGITREHHDTAAWKGGGGRMGLLRLQSSTPPCNEMTKRTT